MNKKIFVVALLTFIVDQISKIVIEKILIVNKSVIVLKNFFSLTLVYNKGAAWGLFSNNRLLLILITLIALILIVSFLKSFKKNTRNNIAFGLLLGGMSGNLIDRIIYGHVRDFLDFTIVKYDYPVFNIGDIAIVISIILLAYAILKGEDSDGNTSKRE